MPVTVVATPNLATCNSYVTTAEAQAYFDTRVAVAGWTDAVDKGILVIMATRSLDAALTARRQFVAPARGNKGYYIVRPTWTGTCSALNLSKLAWGRASMLDRNGVAIAETVFPQELKDATSELAGALGTADLLLDNAVAVQGITSIKAGSVALTFAEGGAMMSKVLSDAVLDLLVPSWLTEQVIQGMYSASFEVTSS